jgi:hypothetical protein
MNSTAAIKFWSRSGLASDRVIHFVQIARHQGREFERLVRVRVCALTGRRRPAVQAFGAAGAPLAMPASRRYETIAMTRAKRFAARIALLAASSALAVLAAEWLVRVSLPQFDPALQLRFEQHGDLVLGKPSSSARQSKSTGDYDVTVHVGPRGFRDSRDVSKARPGDILVAGDSFAFGWGVEENERFSNRLEAALARRVFNIAIPGQDLEGYARLVRYAEKLGARASELVLALCVETDVGSYAAPPQSDTSARAAFSNFLADLDGSLIDRFALRQLTAAAVHHTPWLEAAAIKAGVVRPNLLGVGRGSFTSAEVQATAERIATLARGYKTSVLIVPSRGL